MGKRSRDQGENGDNRKHSSLYKNDDGSPKKTKYTKLKQKQSKPSIDIAIPKEHGGMKFDQNDKTRKEKKKKLKVSQDDNRSKSEETDKLNTVVTVQKKKKKHDKKGIEDMGNKGEHKIRHRKKSSKRGSGVVEDSAIISVDDETSRKSEAVTQERKEARKRKKKEKQRKKMESKSSTENEKGDNPETPDTLQMGLDYLNQWNKDRQNWKFQKVRQVWLLHNMYDAKKIDEESFQTILLYLEGLQGKSREITQKQAEDILNMAEDSDGETKAVPQGKVERARQIIQLLS